MANIQDVKGNTGEKSREDVLVWLKQKAVQQSGQASGPLYEKKLAQLTASSLKTPLKIKIPFPTP